MNNYPTNDIERALAKVVLAAPAIDRDALMHRAGYVAGEAAASRRPALRVWRAAACVSAVACLVLAFRDRDAAPDSHVATNPSTSRSPLSSHGEVEIDQLAWDLDSRFAVRSGAAKPPSEGDGAAVATPQKNAPPTAQQLRDEILSQLATGNEA